MLNLFFIIFIYRNIRKIFKYFSRGQLYVTIYGEQNSSRHNEQRNLENRCVAGNVLYTAILERYVNFYEHILFSVRRTVVWLVR